MPFENIDTANALNLEDLRSKNAQKSITPVEVEATLAVVASSAAPPTEEVLFELRYAIQTVAPQINADQIANMKVSSSHLIGRQSGTNYLHAVEINKHVERILSSRFEIQDMKVRPRE